MRCFSRGSSRLERGVSGRLVSIIINNFNYARFLGAAIESALHQSHPHVEVVVVDDGSTDHSREVIARFGDRVRAVYQENGGQTAALNAGIAASSGEVVFFLDADDRLRPEAASRILAAMAPEVSAVQFCLETIDGDGRSLGGVYPPMPPNWTAGRIRETVLRDGLYPCPPMSGNAFARWYLDKVMPLPTQLFRYGADGPLNAVAPLYGDVIALPDVLGEYRFHGGNHHAQAGLAAEKFLYNVAVDRRRAAFLRWHCEALGLFLPDDVLDRSWFHLQFRLAGLKLCRDRYPVPTDTLPRLVRCIALAARRAPAPALTRLLVVLWAVLVAVMPRRTAERLVAVRFVGGNRPSALDAALRALGLVRRSGRHARTRQDPSLLAAVTPTD
jgi:glycosyltransferase involved in cell wall biosynthesis